MFSKDPGGETGAGTRTVAGKVLMGDPFYHREQLGRMFGGISVETEGAAVTRKTKG